MLLVHGNSHSSRAFEALSECGALAEYRLVALDLPGHGRSVSEGHSSRGSLGSSLGGHIAALSCVVERLAAPLLAVVGHSLGGHIALQAAERLEAKGVMVVGTPPARSAGTLVECYSDHPAVGLALSPCWSDADVDAWCEVQTPAGQAPPAHLRADAVATPGRARSEFVEGLSVEPYEDEVAALQSFADRAAICVGEHDRLLNGHYMRQLPAATTWRGAIHTIAGAGHGPHYQRPAAFGELLNVFLHDLQQAS
ncbi:MAG: alpha/beta hydrolase [Deltaproteobacteria bacterium]|nr:alpha/beta hydrolase [Deltaproteobacteria bacterium]